jgi:hypothetical protein
MIIGKIRHFVLGSLAAATLTMVTGHADAAAQWVRNLTITAVAETDGTVQVAIVQSGTMQWVSVASSSSGAQRFHAAMTAAWLAGKKLDVKVDFAAASGCGTTNTNCENALGWFVHN